MIGWVLVLLLALATEVEIDADSAVVAGAYNRGGVAAVADMARPHSFFTG
jgi:hypothetical protein